MDIILETLLVLSFGFVTLAVVNCFLQVCAKGAESDDPDDCDAGAQP